MDQQLQAFITVAEKQNFTRAAEALYLTQSAVTLAIKSLEKKYQVKLFDRTSKYVRLTKAGEVLYHYGKEIMNNYQKAARLIEDLSHSAKGNLLIGSSFTFGEYILPHLIAQFNQLYPEIEQEISIMNTSRIIKRLLDGELDLAIIEGKVENEKLEIIPFAKDEMMIIVSTNHPLAMSEEVELSELANETWILREIGSGTRQTVDRLFEENNFTPKTTRTYGSSQIIKESVEAGLGISVLSPWIFRKELTLGTIKSLRIKNYPLLRNFSYAISKSEFRPKATELFLDFLLENTFV